MGVLLHTFDGE
jgi:ribonuclease HI